MSLIAQSSEPLLAAFLALFAFLLWSRDSLAFFSLFTVSKKPFVALENNLQLCIFFVFIWAGFVGDNCTVDGLDFLPELRHVLCLIQAAATFRLGLKDQGVTSLGVVLGLTDSIMHNLGQIRQ